MTPKDYGPWTAISDTKTTTWHQGWKKKPPHKGSVHYYLHGQVAPYKEFQKARAQGRLR